MERKKERENEYKKDGNNRMKKKEKASERGAWHMFESGGTKWRYIRVCACAVWAAHERVA